jgi:glycosyltransferase involved in cell wall biosynthesis
VSSVPSARLDGHPTVSVVIIFLNAGTFLQEAIESVLSQTYPHWELVLVDDGSTDTSTAIAQRYAREHPGRIRYTDHPGHENRGMSASRNRGLGSTGGEYVAFLDADDVWLPAKLEAQVAILQREPAAAMVFGPPLIWHSWTGDPHDARRDYVADQLGARLDTLVPPPILAAFLLEGSRIGTTPLPSSILVRRQVVDQVGGFEDTFRGLCEDLVFASKVCLARPVFVAAACWVKYRQHPDSSCSVAERSEQMRPAVLTFLVWLERYLTAARMDHGAVWEALQRRLWRYRHPVRHQLRVRVASFQQSGKALLRLGALRLLPGPVYRRLRGALTGLERPVDRSRPA